MKRGLFITFEGPEGSGKTTHALSLMSWLKKQGYSVLVTYEPGGTALGRRLRRMLLDSRGVGIDPLVELCLYEASRAALVSEVIRPALKAGKIVIVDRFQDSTWVYQGWAGGMDLQLVEKIGRAATKGLEPDLTILLDLPVRRGLARVKHPNRFEAKPVSFHQKVRQGYGVLLRRQKRRIRRVRADRPVQQVQKEIQRIAENVLEKHRRE